MQKTMLQHQSKLIQEMTEKMKNSAIKDEKRNSSPCYLSAKDEQVKNGGLHQNLDKNPANFKQLYKKVKNGQKYDSNNDESDNDSFITIDTSDEDSDYTLDTSKSSDSGFIDTLGSYGVNPMFSKSVEDQTSTTSRACKEFVYIRQNKVKYKAQEPETDDVADELRLKSLVDSQTAPINRSQRKIVILQDKSAIIVNESCLI